MKEKLPLPEPCDLPNLLKQAIPLGCICELKSDRKINSSACEIKMSAMHLNEFADPNGKKPADFIDNYRNEKAKGFPKMGYYESTIKFIQDLQACQTEQGVFLTVVTFKKPNKGAEIGTYPNQYMAIMEPPEGEKMLITVVGAAPVVDNLQVPLG